MIRLFILILVLAPLGWWLDREQKAGRFQRVDELFLDFLVANARERLTSADPAAAEDAVLLIRLDPSQRDEYSAWPPAPLDWQMILKGLEDYDPSVVVVTDVLSWPKPEPQFIPSLAEAIVPLPSVVLGAEAQLSEVPGYAGSLQDSLTGFRKVGGDVSLLRGLGGVLAAPHEAVRRHAEPGLLVEGPPAYALRTEDRVVPAMLAQVMARHTRSPFATHRLLVGPGAGAYLNDGVFVPLEPDGTFSLKPTKPLPTIHALDLLAGGLADALGPENKSRLQKAKIIVIGQDDATQPGVARAYAESLAAILALPRLRVLQQVEQWMVWGVVVLMGMWLVLCVPRQKAPARGMLLIFVVIVAVFLAFQTSLFWFPPTLPVALLSASAVVGGLFGRGESAGSLDRLQPGDTAA